jgi:hypothetical protein
MCRLKLNFFSTLQPPSPCLQEKPFIPLWRTGASDAPELIVFDQTRVYQFDFLDIKRLFHGQHLSLSIQIGTFLLGETSLALPARSAQSEQDLTRDPSQ